MRIRRHALPRRPQDRGDGPWHSGNQLRGRQRMKRRASAHVLLGAGGPTNALPVSLRCAVRFRIQPSRANDVGLPRLSGQGAFEVARVVWVAASEITCRPRIRAERSRQGGGRLVHRRSRSDQFLWSYLLLDPCFEGREQIVLGIGTCGQEAIAKITWADSAGAVSHAGERETGDRNRLCPYSRCGRRGSD